MGACGWRQLSRVKTLGCFPGGFLHHQVDASRQRLPDLVEEAEIGFVQGLWRIGLEFHQ